MHRSDWRVQRALRDAFPVVAGAVGVLALLSLPVLVAVDGTARGVVAGIVVMGFAWLAGLAYLTWSGRTRAGRRGADPTAEALRPLVSQGWKTLANARLGRSGELDHLAIGPAGILLVETKRRREAPTERDLHAALRQVRHNLRELTATMGTAVDGVPVQGVVVVWGPHEGLEPTTFHDGVLVIAGDHLPAWLENLSTSALDDQQAARLYERVLHHVHAGARDEATGPARRIPTRAA